MFPFSSITSIIPLAILAFAYVLYFFAAALNKNIPEDSIDSVQKKEVFTDLSFENQPVRISELHYYDIQYKDILTEEDQDEILPYRSVSLLIPDKPRKIISHFYCFCLSSRPPPVIS